MKSFTEFTELSSHLTPTGGRATSFSILEKYFPEVKNRAELRVLDAIAPELTNGPWIAGGAPLQWYLGKECETDIDVWCRNKKQEDKVSHGLQTLGFRELARTDNALTLRHDIKYECDNKATKFKTITVQLIKRMYPESAKEIIEDFDFTVCQLVTDGVTYVAGRHTYKDIKTRRLRLVDYKPKTFLKRYIKYVTYGYKPDPDLIIDAFEQHKLTTKFKVDHEYDF